MRTLHLAIHGNGPSSRSKDAILKILASARDILVHEGYPKLTMRKVARKAGISLGNLCYHFPTKSSLLHHLLEAVIQGYVLDFDQITKNTHESSSIRLRKLIKFLFDDLATDETSGFFPALWALAAHDPSARTEMKRIYSIERLAFERIIKEIRPDLDAKDSRLLALFVSATIEGHTMFVGQLEELSSSISEMGDMVASCICDVISNIDVNEFSEFEKTKLISPIETDADPISSRKPRVPSK